MAEESQPATPYVTEESVGKHFRWTKWGKSWLTAAVVLEADDKNKHPPVARKSGREGSSEGDAVWLTSFGMYQRLAQREERQKLES